MKHLFSAVLILLLAAGALLAQGPGGGGAQGPGGGGMHVTGNTLMATTPKGLFVLRNGVLGKFEPATLKSTAVLELFGPLPAAPAAGDRDARQAYSNEVQKRMAAPIMLVKDNTLLVVIGDGFARIDQETLKSDALSLTSPNAPAQADGRGFRQEGEPGYLLVGNTLYLMRGMEILSIDIANMKILARGPLPKELQPLQFNFGGGFGGGNNNNRNGGGGGNRNGGGNQ